MPRLRESSVGAIAGGFQVVSQEFLVQSFRSPQKTLNKSAPTHLNLADLHFLLLAVGHKVFFDFFALCTGTGDMVI